MTETESTTTQTTTPAKSGAEGEALAALQRDNADLAKQLDMHKAAAATAITERDTFRGQLEQAAPRLKRHDELVLQLEAMTNEKRESAVIAAVREAAPHVESLALRGVVSQLHDAKKINRFAEDAAAESAKILDLIKREAPSLLTRPTSGGGSPGAREQAPAASRPGFLI